MVTILFGFDPHMHSLPNEHIVLYHILFYFSRFGKFIVLPILMVHWYNYLVKPLARIHPSLIQSVLQMQNNVIAMGDMWIM